MTEPSEAAMKVWREAVYAYGRLSMEGKPDKAAALVIDRAMVAGEPVAAPDTAALVTENEAMRKFIKSLDERWMQFNSRCSDEYDEGYDDALADIAKDARALIAQHKGAEHG